MLKKISVKRIEMKTWAGKIVSGTLVTLMLIMLVPEKSFGQFGMGNTLAPLAGNDYPITFTNDSKGGHHQVATIADRNKITTLRRQPGMLCTVMNDGTGKTKTYQLVCADTKADRDNNANWVLFGSTGGGGTTPSGNGMLYGITNPLPTNGNVGDFYVNISNNTLFGPKKDDSSWPVLQLQGTPTGPAGGDLSGTFPNPIIATDAVTTDKILNKSITADKLGDNAVKQINIGNKAVGTAQIEPGTPGYVLVTDTLGDSVVWVSKSSFLSVLDGKTLTGAGTSTDPYRVNDLGILSKHLAEGAVTSSKLATDAVITDKIQDGAVTEGKIALGSVTSSKLAIDAVITDKIQNAAVTEGKIALGSVTSSKLAIDAVITDKIQNAAVTTEKINDGAVTSSKLATDAVTTEKILNKSITADKLGDKAVKQINIDDKAVGTAQIEPGTPGYVLVTNTLGDAVVWVSKSSFLSVMDEKTLTGAGTVTDPYRVNDLGILSKHLAEGAVTSSKLATDAVITDKIQDGAVTEGKIALGSVTSSKLATDAVITDKIQDAAVTEGKIALGSVTSSKLATAAVTTEKIAINAVTADKINDGAVTESKIATASVSTIKLGTESVTEEKIASNSVSSLKLIDNAVTSSKIASNAVTTTKLDNKAVTPEKIQEGKPNQMLVTNAEGVVTWSDITTGGGSGGTFNGNRPIVGGPYNGVNPKTNDIGKWIEAVFYPSASPTASISPTPALGVKEMTSTGGSSSVALKWKVTRTAGSEAIKDITVDGVSVFTSSPAENGSVEGTTNGTIKNNENKNFTVVATTTDGKTGTASTGVVFQWKRYVGFVNGGEDGVPFAPTNAQIISLSGSDFGTAAAFSQTVTPTGSQKLVIAYPVQWGGSKIIVGVNDSTGAFDRTVRSFTNASGGTIDYVIYVQKDNTGAGYTVAVQ